MKYIFVFKCHSAKAGGSGHTIIECKNGLSDEAFINARKEIALKVGLEVGEIVNVTIQSIVNL